MVRFALFATLLAGAPVMLAAIIPRAGCQKCNVASAKPDLPPGETNVTIPAGQTIQAIALGVGVQNYSCTDAGTYISAGALALLCDTSCEFGKPEFSTIAPAAFDTWNQSADNDLARVSDDCSSKNFAIFGDHYSVEDPNGGLEPLPAFDARATSKKDDPNAFTVTNVTGFLDAPTGNQDIAWAQLATIEGSLSKTVLRVDTKFGQPPSSCTPGSGIITVKYATNYYFLV